MHSAISYQSATNYVSNLEVCVMLTLRRTVLALSCAAAFGAVPSVTHAQVSVPSTIATSGSGEAKVTPDRVAVMVNVQTRAATAAAAASENAKRTAAVLDALGKLGLPKSQLTTEGYTVYPETRYDQNGQSPRVTGYVVTNTVRAESHRPEQAGTIVDAALGAGANMINGLSFYASSIDAPRREAIADAVASARADAEAMARAAGGSLGSLIELSTQGPTVPPRPMYDMSMVAQKRESAVPTPVNPGEQTINVYVSARWQFVPGR
jgi:uncharacterized protein YggE